MSDKRKVISFAPNRLVGLYLDRIESDLKITRPSTLMNKIVAEYFAMKYGEDVRREVRNEFLEKEFEEY